MSEIFKILIDRLKSGETLKIQELLDPLFLSIDEPELRFTSKVEVQGDAYLTDTHLVIRLKAKVTASMPCAVCNQMIDTELKVQDFYHAEPLEEIRGAIFDFSAPLREALLIELPKYVECNRGKCPDRATIAPYLRSQARVDKTTYFPFSDMDIK